MGVAYAYVQGRWVKCISQYYSIFSGRSEKELLLASIEIKQQAKLSNTSSTISAKRLADFLSSVTSHEALLLQRLRDLEGQNVLNSLAQKSQSVPVSRTESEQFSPHREIVPLQKRKGVLPLDLAQVPLFEEYR
jgi:putative transposase